MKRQSKKLKLNKTTLRTLLRDEAEDVKGAAPFTWGWLCTYSDYCPSAMVTVCNGDCSTE